MSDTRTIRELLKEECGLMNPVVLTKDAGIAIMTGFSRVLNTQFIAEADGVPVDWRFFINDEHFLHMVNATILRVMDMPVKAKGVE